MGVVDSKSGKPRFAEWFSAHVNLYETDILRHNWCQDCRDIKGHLRRSGNLPYEDGGISELIKIADGGLQVFHVGFTNLDKGWQGSVTQDSPVSIGTMARYSSGMTRTTLGQIFHPDCLDGGLIFCSVALADGSAKAPESFCGLRGPGTS